MKRALAMAFSISTVFVAIPQMSAFAVTGSDALWLSRWPMTAEPTPLIRIDSASDQATVIHQAASHPHRVSNWQWDPAIRRFTRTNDGLVVYVAERRIWAKDVEATATPARSLATVEHVCSLKTIPALLTDAMLIVTTAPKDDCEQGSNTHLLQIADGRDILLPAGEEILPNGIFYDVASGHVSTILLYHAGTRTIRAVNVMTHDMRVLGTYEGDSLRVISQVANGDAYLLSDRVLYRVSGTRLIPIARASDDTWFVLPSGNAVDGTHLYVVEEAGRIYRLQIGADTSVELVRKDQGLLSSIA